MFCATGLWKSLNLRRYATTLGANNVPSRIGVRQPWGRMPGLVAVVVAPTYQRCHHLHVETCMIRFLRHPFAGVVQGLWFKSTISMASAYRSKTYVSILYCDWESGFAIARGSWISGWYRSSAQREWNRKRVVSFGMLEFFL